jgi:hypothetical protein
VICFHRIFSEFINVSTPVPYRLVELNEDEQYQLHYRIDYLGYEKLYYRDDDLSIEYLSKQMSMITQNESIDQIVKVSQTTVNSRW